MREHCEENTRTDEIGRKITESPSCAPGRATIGMQPTGYQMTPDEHIRSMQEEINRLRQRMFEQEDIMERQHSEIRAYRTILRGELNR